MTKLFAICLLVCVLSGCAASPAPDRLATPTASLAPTLEPVAQAALEATRIVQNARATAIIKQAQAEAATLAQPVATSSSVPLPPTEARSVTSTPALTATLQPTGTATPSGPQMPAPSPTPVIRVVGVGFAANGEYIHVKYFAPPALISQWRQGLFSVIDEATGEVYNEIPVMAIVGPMIGRPVRPEQMAYVMLVNRVPRLQAGAMVTVVLDRFRFEHVVVQP